MSVATFGHYIAAGAAWSVYACLVLRIATITHNSLRAMAVMAFFLPVRPASRSKTPRQRGLYRTKSQADSMSAHRKRRDPFFSMGSSFRLPALSRHPGARPA